MQTKQRTDKMETDDLYDEHSEMRMRMRWDVCMGV